MSRIGHSRSPSPVPPVQPQCRLPGVPDRGRAVPAGLGSPPRSWTNTLSNSDDSEVGGTRLVRMQMPTPDGPTQMWFTGGYHEIAPNERLVYAESVCDEKGNVLFPSDMGMPRGDPGTTTVTVELQEIGGRTNMVLTHAGVPADSPARPIGRWRSRRLPTISKAHSVRWAFMGTSGQCCPGEARTPKRAHLDVLASHTN